jgi:hypothetical protein
MGFESDKLVYDYLSQVGDLAQSTALTAAERARLVTRLRQDIDARRAAAGGRGDAPKDVRKLLDRMGTPEDVVRRALSGGVPEGGGAVRRSGPAVPGPAVPVQGNAPGGGRTTAGTPEGPAAPQGGVGRQGAAGHGGSAGAAHEAPEGGAGEWWRLADGASAGAFPGAGPGGPPPLNAAALDFGPWDSVEFDFGYDQEPVAPPVADPLAKPEASLPEQARMPRQTGLLGRVLGAPAVQEQPPAPPPPPPTLLQRLFGARPAQQPPAAEAPPAAPRRRLLARRAPRPVSGPLLLMEALASLALLAGAVLGLWYLSVLGWIAAYFSARLGPTARKLAGLGIPLLTAVGGVVWLWLRATGRWGGPALTGNAYHQAVHHIGPVLLRTASALSSAFLAWLVYRQRTR